MNRHAIAPLLITCLALAVGCGGADVEVQTPTADDGPTTTSEDAPSAAAPPAAGEIARADLDRVLERGPAAVLGAVELDPVREGQRFVGFRIAAFTAGPPPSVDLRIDDVVLKVNGRPVERPEQYFAIFEELKVASELRFDILRGGEPLTLSYPIVSQ